MQKFTQDVRENKTLVHPRWAMSTETAGLHFSDKHKLQRAVFQGWFQLCLGWTLFVGCLDTGWCLGSCMHSGCEGKVVIARCAWSLGCIFGYSQVVKWPHTITSIGGSFTIHNSSGSNMCPCLLLMVDAWLILQGVKNYEDMYHHQEYVDLMDTRKSKP